MTEAPGVATRRQPQQERSQLRVERILDAAAAVIAEVGVEAATTNAIAAQAGTSIGSIYHFFPNKDAIVVALSERYGQQMRAVSEQTLKPEISELPLAVMMEGIVRQLAAFHEHNPAYAHVYHATMNPVQPSCGDRELHAAIEGMVAALLRHRSPYLTAAEITASAKVYVETVHAMLEVAAQSPPPLREALKRELVRMMVLYGEDLMRQSASRAPAAGP